MTYKGFITTLMAAAIALTGAAAKPAKADDTAKIIAGVAALAIIGTAIAKSKRNDHGYVTRRYVQPQRYYVQRPRHGYRYVQPQRHGHRHWVQRGHRGHNGYRGHRAPHWAQGR
jgi:hypothetical protein